MGMKAVILAGGLGTRITEESHLKPKPMIEIGNNPILWHVMKIYAHYGITDFIICAGYKQHVIKEYFADYYLHRSDVTFDFSMDGAVKIHNNVAESWKVTVVDTGLNTMTGGRVKRIRDYVGAEPFFLTYGDGVADVDINKLLEHHVNCGKVATMTAVSVQQRFGVLNMSEDGIVTEFREKFDNDGHIINGGFMVFQPEIFDYIDGDDTVLERQPLERLAQKDELAAYYHSGFWQCMDTLRDKLLLDELVEKGNAPWIKW